MTDSDRLVAIHQELDNLRALFDENACRLAEFVEIVHGTRLDIVDLSVRWGVSVSTLEHSPWRLPNYGRPDQTGSNGRREWFLPSVRAVELRPENERRDEWDRMSATERRRALGRTA